LEQYYLSVEKCSYFFEFLSKKLKKMTTTHHHNTQNTYNTHDTTLIEMRVVKAKPEYIWHLLNQAETLKKLYERTGVKVLALWMTQAGATHEFITLVEFTSAAQRAQYKDFRMTDPEFVKFDITIAKYYYEIEDYICKTSVNFPTLKTINPTGKYLVQMLKYKGFLPFDSKKLAEATIELERAEGENSCPAVGILVPMMSKHQCLIVIREWPTDSKADSALNSYRDALLDSKNWPHMYDTSKHVARERSVLVRNIPFDKVRENAAME